MQVQPYNRPDLRGNGSGLPIMAIDAELKVDCIDEGVGLSVGPRE